MDVVGTHYGCKMESSREVKSTGYWMYRMEILDKHTNLQLIIFNTYHITINYLKTLYLIRHAKSSWDSAALHDFERPLNKRGERDAPNMAKRLKEKHVLPDMMLSSPANRTLTTCKVFARLLGFSTSKITTNQSLYHANGESILDILKDTPSFVRTLLLFGHNPGFTDFANELMDEHIHNIPTTGIVACTLPIHLWSELDWGKGEMILFDYPKK